MGSLHRVRTAAVLTIGVGVLIGAAVTAWHLLTRESDRGTTVGTTWDYYEPSRNAVTIHALVRGCDDVDDVLVEEDDASVTITMVVDSVGLFCGMVATDVATRVRLERPLGDRAVYDGGCIATGRPAAECVRTRQPQQRADHPEDVAVTPPTRRLLRCRFLRRSPRRARRLSRRQQQPGDVLGLVDVL